MDKMDILLRFSIRPEYESEEDAKLTEKYTSLGNLLNELEIDSREKTIAIEKLEESFMWARKGNYV